MFLSLIPIHRFWGTSKPLDMLTGIIELIWSFVLSIKFYSLASVTKQKKKTLLPFGIKKMKLTKQIRSANYFIFFHKFSKSKLNLNNLMYFRDYLYIANWYTIRINCIWYCLLYHIFNCKKMTNANDFSYFHKFVTSEMIKIRSILRDLIPLYLYLLIQTIIIQFHFKYFFA